MNFFVSATPAPQPKTENVSKVALLFGGLILAMTIAQLFHFEKFIPLIEGFDLPGGELTAHLFAASIVTLEVASLPFLLRMYLSPAMRFVSMISGWIVVIFWLFVQIYLNLQHSSIENSGLLGVAVPIETGWWVVFMLAGFGILLAWASWGMWPLERFRK
jgi:hypothetical protein